MDRVQDEVVLGRRRPLRLHLQRHTVGLLEIEDVCQAYRLEDRAHVVVAVVTLTEDFEG